MNAKEYASKVTDLFVLPDSCVRIKELIDSDTASVEELADVISYDPVLTAIILRLANSAFYNFRTEVTTVKKAIQIIGSRGIYNLVMGYGTKAAFEDLDSQAIDLELFWEMSVKVALISKQLGKIIRYRDAEGLFVCGLLHNIGELVVTQVNPNQAHSCREDRSQTVPWTKQVEELGFTYAECSLELLKVWELPSSFISPIADIQKAINNDGSLESKLIYVAMCQMISLTYPERFGFDDLVSEAYLKSLKLSKADLEEATEYAVMEGISILAMLSPGSISIY